MSEALNKERDEELLEKPWVLVVFVLGIFASLYAALWLAYIFEHHEVLG